MNIVGLLFAGLAIIGWGAYPTLVSKIGGSPIQAIFGATWGTLLVAIVLALSCGLAMPTGANFWLALVSGAAWAFGNVLTIQAFRLRDDEGNELGSAKAMPISTAFQITANVLWGVIMLGNWPSTTSRAIGAVAVIAVLIGAYLTTYQQHKTQGNKGLLLKAMGVLLIAQVGYSLYGILPQYTQNTDGLHLFLPQAIGMALFGLALGLFETMKNNDNIFAKKQTYLQLISGLFFAMAALGYLVSAQPAMLGLATGFVLSQVSIVFATVSGILVMGVYKTKKEWLVIGAGLLMIVVGASITAFL
ncbi:GRP family sugar transporter [Weissella tructae]|jgi:putative ribose uptake protein|uniref:Ribose transporter RbsU n=2 Tax=Weissella TaxID=46255 RepID=A0ABM5QQG0_9LACO|nr:MULTISPECIES: GRP family sugar transporter [Weissella]AIG65107.1 Putative ribose transporter RbsU [Weissella tructae]AIM62420.1 Putative ribose transporter RbsU [Weissella ceti]AIM63757.1 Putative ribose transporter RbsU [Weissella ceti]ELA07911.1 ribose transporter RbsU [Weissella ceti NC36]QVV91498.1 GRP family sugar transporter [Weissella tructae]